MDNNAINWSFDGNYQKHEYKTELTKISNQIKSAYGIKILKRNLLNFIATMDIT